MFEAVLKKQKLLNQIIQSKNDTLNLDKRKKNFTFGGKILKVSWKTKYTKFDITDYVKVSKKQRTNISEKKIKTVLDYSLVGYCYNYKKGNINTSFSIRNVIDGFALEMILPLYSVVIKNIAMFRNKKSLVSSRNKMYILRTKTLPLSTIKFNYVHLSASSSSVRRKKTIKKLR